MPRPQKRREERGEGGRRRRTRTPAFDLLTSRIFLGSLWLLTGLLAILVVFLEPVSVADRVGWIQARSEPATAQAMALLFVVGLAGLAGGLWRRISARGEGEYLIPVDESDGSEEEERSLQEAPRRTRAALIGAVALVVGFGVIAGDWLSSHRSLPAGELVLPANQSRESYQVRQGAREVEVMLPLRMTLRNVDFGEEPRAFIRFARPGQQSAAQEFHPGRSLDVEGLRFVFAGFAKERGALRVVMSSEEENTVSAAGVAGDTLRFELDGPGVQIVEAVENYLDVLGPAVKLEGEDGEAFWVFQRAGGVEAGPRFGHSLRLERMEMVPAAVMKVTPVRPIWPFGLGLTLVLLGGLLFVAFPDRGGKKVEGGWKVWSLNRSTELSGEKGGNRAALLAALALPVGVILGALALAARGSGPSIFTEASPAGLLLLGPGLFWLAMATLLLAAGIRSEGARTKGLTGALAILGLSGSVIAIGARRGGPLGESFAMPLSSAATGEGVYWHIPGVSALSELKIPVVAGSSDLLFLAGLAAAGAILAVVLQVVGKERVSTVGWAMSALASAGAALTLLGEKALSLPGAQAYEFAAGPWLQGRQLPQRIASEGAFSIQGNGVVRAADMIPEVIAFFVIAALAVMMLICSFRESDGGKSKGEKIRAGGRDLFAAALAMGVVGWGLGLALTADRLGAAGTLAPMEWLGIGAIFIAMGFLTLGWRRGPTVVEWFSWTFGAGLTLLILIAVIASGAVGGVLPGMSLSVLY